MGKAHLLADQLLNFAAADPVLLCVKDINQIVRRAVPVDLLSDAMNRAINQLSSAQILPVYAPSSIPECAASALLIRRASPAG